MRLAALAALALLAAFLPAAPAHATACDVPPDVVSATGDPNCVKKC